MSINFFIPLLFLCLCRKITSEKVCTQEKKFDGQTFYSVDNQCIIKWGGWFLKLAETKSLTPYVFHPILGGIRLPESLHLSQAVK